VTTRRSPGIAGSAVLAGTAGLYLVYTGWKDVPFFDGLRSLLRKETPQPRASHAPFTLTATGIGKAGAFVSKTLGPVQAGDTGIERLVGNAIGGYNVIRAMGTWQIGGWGLRLTPGSDHPKGLAIDVMHPTGAEAQTIIATFKGLPGAKYWIWNRQIAEKDEGWVPKRYTGTSPHTDHVHLSFD
jgi:hypothetical protein